MTESRRESVPQFKGTEFASYFERADSGRSRSEGAISVHHGGSSRFRGRTNPFPAARYHSPIFAPAPVPRELSVTAHGPGGVVFGVRHRTELASGVPFPPESFLTLSGLPLLRRLLGQASR